MLVRTLRAILAKLPDDARVLVRVRGTYIDAQSAGYAHTRNAAAIITDDLEATIAMDAFIKKSIDGL